MTNFAETYFESVKSHLANDKKQEYVTNILNVINKQKKLVVLKLANFEFLIILCRG